MAKCLSTTPRVRLVFELLKCICSRCSSHALLMPFEGTYVVCLMYLFWESGFNKRDGFWSPKFIGSRIFT